MGSPLHAPDIVRALQSSHYHHVGNLAVQQTGRLSVHYFSVATGKPATSVFLSTALAVVLAAASGAHADTKVYNGNACQAQQGEQAVNLFRSTVDVRVNPGSPGLNVTCPIVRDNTENLDGIESADVRVQSPTTE